MRGKLRIYFGYAAGVGKTYAMLEGAHEALVNGNDVVVGYIEPHDRPETTALIAGLTSLPTKNIVYRGIKLREFDLDPALERHPQLILVDELAHTNAYGSRNKKRFQDIEELLHAGIDVYTTVNVQHIESLMDQVERITGIRVNERVPDYIFDKASQIELVDIDPADLLERLSKGKIYRKTQANLAAHHFFTEEKLFALREIALRKTADQVNKNAQQQEFLSKNGYTKEHILVCVSPSPTAPVVIRAASRLANAFKAEFTALHVGNVDEENLSHDANVQLQRNLRLAEQLGAKISVIYGADFAKQVAEYAKVSHVSKLVIGKTPEKRWFRRINMVDSLSELAPELDIYIIPNAKSEMIHKPWLSHFHQIRFSLSDMLKTIGMLIVCTLLGLAFDHWNFNVSNIITIYILGVQINAVITKGRIFSVISSVLSVLCFNYFFTAPYYSFEAFNPSYPMTFLIMLSAGLITTTLIKRIQGQARLNAEKSRRTEILLQTNKELQLPDSPSEILNATAQALNKLLERDVVIYPTENETLQPERYFATETSVGNLATYESLKERGVAEWVLHNNKRAGATTDTLSASQYLYLSVRRKERVFAVIGIRMLAKIDLEPFEKSILLAILGEAALALEKEVLRNERQHIAVEMQQEQLRSNLLRAISHDLRTPLTSISGHAKLLMENGKFLDETKKDELFAYIYDDSMWLINLVENLLSITKLDSAVKLDLQINSIDDVILEAVNHIDRHLVQHDFKLDLSDDVLFAKLDSPLILQVLINIVNNAVKYTPIGSKIILSTAKVGNQVQIEISDDGFGISDEAKTKIFDLFYTAEKSTDTKRGLGIGLSLCKTIINAHGGEIYAKDNQPKGLIIGFTLPIVEVNINE